MPARGTSWRRSERRRLRAIRDRLRAAYGRPVLRPHRAPIDELVLTVLSQNTNDRNRDVAYARLRERFASWDEVREASLERAHDELLRLCGDDGGFAYETHVLLIRHGRRTCMVRAPRCPECPLRRMCPEGKRRLRAARAGGSAAGALARTLSAAWRRPP